MPKFSYRAITETGTTTKGEIEAESADKASSLLASQGYIPTRVKEERTTGAGVQLGSVLDFLSPVKAPELILFTKQFNTLIRAGVPMLSLLKFWKSRPSIPNYTKFWELSTGISRKVPACMKPFSGIREFFHRCSATCSKPVRPVAP